MHSKRGMGAAGCRREWGGMDGVETSQDETLFVRPINTSPECTVLHAHACVCMRMLIEGESLQILGIPVESDPPGHGAGLPCLFLAASDLSSIGNSMP